MSILKKNIILIIITIVIIVAPLILIQNGEFAGADGLAEDEITKIDPSYEPWFNPIMEPKSGEIESLLFSTQAAIGAGIVCFILGRMTAKRKEDEDEGNDKV